MNIPEGEHLTSAKAGIYAPLKVLALCNSVCEGSRQRAAELIPRDAGAAASPAAAEKRAPLGRKNNLGN